VIDRFALTDLSVRIVAAPMAGGPSTCRHMNLLSETGLPALASAELRSSRRAIGGPCVLRWLAIACLAGVMRTSWRWKTESWTISNPFAHRIFRSKTGWG
jgi:hypothetical protein